ncbi:MAG: amino acid-binding protein, partial [Haloarculaceae archaeon]
ADAAGIVAQVTSLIAEEGISIRQVLSDDPEFADDPKLYVIIDTEPSGDLLMAIRDLPFVRHVTF